MTHNDIYTKFMIEYDKANVTSSYPSLTKYEVATILDKAYYALIAQKVTGNNPRQIPFESDVKAIADVQPLVKHIDLPFDPLSHNTMGINVAEITIPEDFMYYVQLLIEYDANPNGSIDVGEQSIINQQGQAYAGQDNDGIMDVSEMYYSTSNEEVPSSIDWQNMYFSSTVGDPVNTMAEMTNVFSGPYDKKPIRVVPVKLTSHDVAERFMVTSYNMPWVKNPVAYMQAGKINVVYDPINKPLVDTDDDAHLIYIRKPAPFATIKVDTITEGEEET